MHEVDVQVFRSINGWPASFAPVFVFFSTALDRPWLKVVLALLLIGLFVAKGRYGRTALQALIAVGLANATTDFLKHTFPMHRPFQELADVLMRVGRSDSMGTASAHSANMAAVAFVFCYHLGWWGSPWAVVALLTGLSRSYTGAHYPSQVLLGWTCGVLAALLVTKTWESIMRHRNGVSLEEDANDNRPEIA